jgi:hypothetical protein
MAPDRAVYRSIALHDDCIVALSSTTDGLDGLISPETRVGGDSSWSAQSRQLRYATIPVMFFLPTGLEWFRSANPTRKLALE